MADSGAAFKGCEGHQHACSLGTVLLRHVEELGPHSSGLGGQPVLSGSQEELLL